MRRDLGQDGDNSREQDGGKMSTAFGGLRRQLDWTPAEVLK
jgi:hypothetical protein